MLSRSSSPSSFFPFLTSLPSDIFLPTFQSCRAGGDHISQEACNFEWTPSDDVFGVTSLGMCILPPSSVQPARLSPMGLQSVGNGDKGGRLTFTCAPSNSVYGFEVELQPTVQKTKLAVSSSQ